MQSISRLLAPSIALWSLAMWEPKKILGKRSDWPRCETVAPRLADSEGVPHAPCLERCIVVQKHTYFESFRVRGLKQSDRNVCATAHLRVEPLSGLGGARQLQHIIGVCARVNLREACKVAAEGRFENQDADTLYGMHSCCGHGDGNDFAFDSDSKIFFCDGSLC